MYAYDSIADLTSAKFGFCSTAFDNNVRIDVSGVYYISIESTPAVSRAEAKRSSFITILLLSNEM